MSFKFVKRNVAGDGMNADDVEVTLQGCDCLDQCGSSCSCVGGKVNYSGDVLQHSSDSKAAVLECHEDCSCSSVCGNRVVQKGVQLELTPCFDDRKGYGLLAGQRIMAGQFVAEYTGELIPSDKVKSRVACYKEQMLDHNYIFTVLEHISGEVRETYIDATFFGGLARFINHSCEPNLFPFVVRVGTIAPSLALFAARDIEDGEELTYDYGLMRASGKDEAKTNVIVPKRCLCGSQRCRGVLPCAAYD